MKLPSRHIRPKFDDAFIEDTEWELICLAFECAEFYLLDHPDLFPVFEKMQNSEGLIDFFDISQKVAKLTDNDWIIAFFRGLGFISQHAHLRQFRPIYALLIYYSSELHWQAKFADFKKSLFEKTRPDYDDLIEIICQFKPKQLMHANDVRQKIGDERDQKIFSMIRQIKAEIEQGMLNIEWKMPSVLNEISKRISAKYNNKPPHGFGKQSVRKILKNHFPD